MNELKLYLTSDIYLQHDIILLLMNIIKLLLYPVNGIRTKFAEKVDLLIHEQCFTLNIIMLMTNVSADLRTAMSKM